MRYFRVMKDSYSFVEGTLFTEKELKSLNCFESRGLVLKEVQVKRNDLYWFFGARFSDDFKII